LIKYFKEREPDLVISAQSHVNVITILAKMISGAKSKIVLTYHTNQSIENNHLKSISKKFWLFLEKNFLGYSNHLVAVSKGVARDIERRWNLNTGDVKVIYNPVITEKYLVQSNETICHDWFIERNNVPVIIGVGRFRMQKNFELLIRAFKKVQNITDCRLILLGTGEQEDLLKKSVIENNLESKVHFTGFVSNPGAYLKNSDLFVLSSKWEGFGNVIVESLGVGTKVVSTDCPSGPSEILNNGEFGTLVPMDDIDELAKGILHELNNERSETVLKQRALEYHADKIANEYRSLWQ